MSITSVHAVFFSPTGTTRKITAHIAQHIREEFEVSGADCDFTPPRTRSREFSFSEGDLAIFGVPVYAGRVPNILLPFLGTIKGGNALAVPVAVYGNRNFDDALIELRDILEKGGFRTVAAAAFVGEHSFSTILGAGRPDARDMELTREFAAGVCAKLRRLQTGGAGEPVRVPGTPLPYRGYYQPRDRHGAAIDIRKVKPLTNTDSCTRCGICAEVCPMGSIDRGDNTRYTGICIKCGACIKQCPASAKYYNDAGYLYHKEELEQEYTRRAEPEFFL